jgi:CRISPR-associated protein Csd1
MALDLENDNRSYLFGRLLAIAEQAEKTTYTSGESRETNAIRLQTMFQRYPMRTWRIVMDALNPYFARMNPGLRNYFKNMIGEVVEKLNSTDPAERNRPLDDVYLMGYYLQRRELNQKKEKNQNTESELMEEKEQ